MVIIASISFFSKNRNGDKIERVYKTGLVVDFSIRNDMLNSGKIFFIEYNQVNSGINDVKARILFAHEDLLSEYLKEGVHFTFGEISTLYGEGTIIKIV
jgi:hypothetical protein